MDPYRPLFDWEDMRGLEPSPLSASKSDVGMAKPTNDASFISMANEIPESIFTSRDAMGDETLNKCLPELDLYQSQLNIKELLVNESVNILGHTIRMNIIAAWSEHNITVRHNFSRYTMLHCDRLVGKNNAQHLKEIWL